MIARLTYLQHCAKFLDICSHINIKCLFSFMLYFNILYDSHFSESSDGFFKELSCFENTGNIILEIKLQYIIAVKHVILAQFLQNIFLCSFLGLSQAVHIH